MLLEQASSLLAHHRDADAPPLLERLIARHPELKDDARVAELLLRSASSNNGRAAADSYALLTGQMGEPGAAIAYELSLKNDVPGPSRLRAEKWLNGKAFERVAALPVFAAAKLRGAKTCDDKHALLAFAGNAGGKYVLEYLHEIERKTSCSPEDLVHCYPCMREDTRLSDTIAKLEPH